MNKEEKLELIEGILNDEISSFDYRDIEIEIDDTFFEEDIDAETLKIGRASCRERVFVLV